MSTYNVGNVELSVISKAKEAITTLKGLRSEIRQLSTALNGTKNNIDKVGNSSKKASSSLKSMFTLGKLYVFMNYTKRMAESIAKTVQNAIDYIETLNKFKVSMGDMYSRAVAFQNKMSEAYGLATIDLMNYQANFNNIIKGLGNVDVDVAYNMSETLTQMAVDFASLFNVSIDSAMTKFQSALTQQVRPIRSVSGFDITTPTLQSVLTSLGITDRTIGQLSQVEKRLVIIIALQRQMANVGAMGDFAKTINQPAQQLKILSQQIKETGIAIGNFALHYIAPALKYVLGFVMAIKALITTLAALRGYELDDSVTDPFASMEFEADDATGAVGKTTKAVKDLKKAVTGIDELNIIQQPEEPSDNGGGIGGGVGGIDPRISAELEKYNTLLKDADLHARNIRDKIMQWLGFTKEINPETGEVTWKLKDGNTNLNKIITGAKILAGVLGGIAGLKLFAKVKGIIDLFKNAGIIKLIQRIIMALGGGGGSSAGVGAGAGGASVLATLGQIAGVIAGITFAVIGIKDTIKGMKLNDTEKKVEGIMRTVGGIALAVGSAVGGVAGAIAAILGIAAIAWSYVYEFREQVDEIVNKVWGFTEKLYPFLKPVHGLIKGVMGYVKNMLTNVGKMFNKVKEIYDKIKEIFSALNKLAKAAFKKVWDEIKKNVLDPLWKALKAGFGKIWGWFKETEFGKWVISIADWAAKNFKAIIANIKIAFSSFKEWALGVLEDIINMPAKGAEKIMNFIIKGINMLIIKLNKIPGINIELLNPLTLDKVKLTKDKKGDAKSLVKNGRAAFATGGFPSRGDYFLANENGVPEYVGSIGGRTAVANRNQIVEGISYGVSMAQAQQNALLREQNGLLRQMLAKSGGDVYLDGRKVTNELERNANARGTKLVRGSYSYGY